MISSTAKGGRYVYYACGTFVRQSKNACSGHRVPAEEFQRQALRFVLDWALSDEHVLEVVKRVRTTLLSREDPARELRDELKAANERLQRYYDAFEAGTLDAEDLGVRIRTLKGKRVELEEKIRAHVANPELPASYTTPENIGTSARRSTRLSGTVPRSSRSSGSRSWSRTWSWTARPSR